MPKGPALTAFERGQVELLNQMGESQTKIADFLGRSRSVVQNALKHGDQYNSFRQRGVPPVFSLKGIAGRYSSWPPWTRLAAQQIAREVGTPVRKSTVHRGLEQEPNAEWAKRKCQPPLTTAHKDKRLEFAREHRHWDKEWTKPPPAEKKLLEKWKMKQHVATA